MCAYDRPGVVHRDQTFSRSDPVPQPTSAQDGVSDLVALLKAADVPGPYVLVAHSFSDTIARVFAGEHPDEVKGIVFVDATTPELRAHMTPAEWETFKRINTPAEALAAYPDVERPDFDKTLDQTAAAALKPMPVVVLTASDKYVDVTPKPIQAGTLPPDTPPDFGAVMDRATSAAQNKLAALVPGAVHITDTHSGHFIMVDNAPVVIQAIRMVVDAVRAGQIRLRGEALTDIPQHRPRVSHRQEIMPTGRTINSTDLITATSASGPFSPSLATGHHGSFRGSTGRPGPRRGTGAFDPNRPSRGPILL